MLSVCVCARALERERERKGPLRACTYCFISQPCLCLHLPWVDLKVSHPARSFIEEEITVTSLFGALCAVRKNKKQNIVIVCHHAFFFPFSLLDYNVANIQSCVMS